MRKFAVLSVLLGLAAPAILVGAETQRLTIAVIPKGTTHEFWKAVHAGAVQASRELGVEIIWKGPLREDDRSGQIGVVESMVDRQVSGLVLAPLDDTALRAPVESAVRGGSPVVIIDSALKSDKTVSFVATDNFRGGQLAGEHLGKLLGGKGRVALLRYAEGSASTSDRERGFLEALKKFPGVTLASSNQFAGATVETAYKASENILASLRDAGVQGVFCPNESTTFGMLRALQDAGLAGKVKFVGFDSSEKLVDAMKKGEISALVVQSPMKMGYLGVKTMVEHLRGKKVEARIDTGVTVVTAASLSDPAVRERVLPDLAKWLN
jgi:ribose transport system substrate-binding protein